MLEADAGARRHAELVGVLPAEQFGIEEPGEVGEHAGVEGFAPRRSQRLGGVAEDIQQADTVEAEAGDEHEHHEPIARRLALVLLAPVAADFEDLLAVLVDCHAVGQRQSSRFAVALVLEAANIEFAIALVDGVLAILGLLGNDLHALNIGDGLVDGVGNDT